MAADVTLTHDEVVELAAAYVLGALERDEELAVAEHLRTCDQEHPEMAELGGVVAYLAEPVPQVEPPASLRARILSAAAEDLAARRVERGAPVAPPESPATPTRPASVTPLDAARRSRQSRVGAWALGLAAAFAIVVLGAWNIGLQNDLAAARQYQSQVTAVLDLGQLPGSQVAILAASAPGGPSGVGVLPPTGQGRLVMQGLRPTSGNQVYEIWAIAEGQAPAPVGWFTVDSRGVGFFDRMPSATGQSVLVAVTLETEKDPPAPTTAVLAAGQAILNPPA
jgi:anti-sigma factor RsiW